MPIPYSNIISVLAIISKRFNEDHILWAVGGSFLLKAHQLKDEINDIDILVSSDDIEKVKNIMRGLAKEEHSPKSDLYLTKHFLEYSIKQIDIDIMADLKIKHNLGIYSHPFDNLSIGKYMKIDQTQIPLMSLEDWYVIYRIIPGRKAKADLIYHYLLKRGIKNEYLLQRLLNENLAIHIKESIQYLLKNKKNHN